MQATPSGKPERQSGRRSAADDWRFWLLRVRRERPCGRRAAEQRDELAPSKMIEWHSDPSSRDRAKQDIELARISQRASRR
jgi:hypothetical protein